MSSKIQTKEEFDEEINEIRSLINAQTETVDNNIQLSTENNQLIRNVDNTIATRNEAFDQQNAQNSSLIQEKTQLVWMRIIELI